MTLVSAACEKSGLVCGLFLDAPLMSGSTLWSRGTGRVLQIFHSSGKHSETWDPSSKLSLVLCNEPKNIPDIALVNLPTFTLSLNLRGSSARSSWALVRWTYKRYNCVVPRRRGFSNSTGLTRSEFTDWSKSVSKGQDSVSLSEHMHAAACSYIHYTTRQQFCCFCFDSPSDQEEVECPSSQEPETCHPSMGQGRSNR